MQRWQCQINNGTLESFVCSSLNLITLFLIFIVYYLQLWFLYKSHFKYFYCGKTLRNYQNQTLEKWKIFFPFIGSTTLTVPINTAIELNVTFTSNSAAKPGNSKCLEMSNFHMTKFVGAPEQNSPFVAFLFNSLWVVVNLTSNRTCTDLPDNSVYWPHPMVQYVTLTRLTYDRVQFSWHSPVGRLTVTTPMARSDFLQYPA